MTQQIQKEARMDKLEEDWKMMISILRRGMHVYLFFPSSSRSKLISPK